MIFNYSVYPFLSQEELKKKSSGSNQLGILIVSNSESSPHKELLTKIMAAVGIDLSSILNLEVEYKSCVPFSFYTENNIQKMVIFGIPPSQLSINTNISKYTIETVNGVQVLFSDDLNVISQKTELKRPLWAALQTLFNV